MDMTALMRRLAAMEPDGLPVLSAYLDMRPHDTGEKPALRTGRVVLKDRLREIEKTFLPRGRDLTSFRADAERIVRYLDEDASPAAQGIVVFACSARALFETVEAGVPFENQVSVHQTPDLYQLARLLDEQETVVVAVVDTNTARLFVSRSGFLEEAGGLDEDTAEYRRGSMGGWSQARYQRHIDNNRAAFAREAAKEIEMLADTEGAARLILSGDEISVPLLRQALSHRAGELLRDDFPRLDIRAARDEIAAEVEPVLAEAEAEDARSAADRLVNAVRGDGLGVAGLDATRRALEHGQVDELLLDPASDLDEETRGDLVRLASTTGSAVELVEDHTPFRRMGGVGALLRYRHD